MSAVVQEDGFCCTAVAASLAHCWLTGPCSEAALSQKLSLTQTSAHPSLQVVARGVYGQRFENC
jgi:hypothetical protein